MKPGPPIRRHPDGSIDYDFYRADARRMRNEERRATLLRLRGTARTSAGYLATGGAFAKTLLSQSANYFKFPQNR